MQVIRTIIWLLILVGVLVFSIFNWNPVEVTIWDNLVVETKVPALVIVSFLLGFLPIWLYSRGVTWSLNRKIRSLEIAAKASSVSAAAREAEREEAARQHVADTEPVAESHDGPAEDATDETVVSEDTRLTADDAEPVDDDPVNADATEADAAADETPVEEPASDDEPVAEEIRAEDSETTDSHDGLAQDSDDHPAADEAPEEKPATT